MEQWRGDSLANQERIAGTKLLLMGSKAFRAERLPTEVALKIDEGIARSMTILVAEAWAHAGFTKTTFIQRAIET
jgi:hypothetical protein